MRTLPLAGTLSAVSPGWSSCQGWGGGGHSQPPSPAAEPLLTTSFPGQST